MGVCLKTNMLIFSTLYLCSLIKKEGLFWLGLFNIAVE